MEDAAGQEIVELDYTEGAFGGRILGSILGGLFNHEEPQFYSPASNSESEMAILAMEAYSDSGQTEEALGGPTLAASLGGQHQIRLNSPTDDFSESRVSALVAMAALDLSGEGQCNG
jgi:hypothetical protein